MSPWWIPTAAWPLAALILALSQGATGVSIIPMAALNMLNPLCMLAVFPAWYLVDKHQKRGAPKGSPLR